MKKVFMDRTVHPSETIKKQKDYIDNKLELQYSLEIDSTPDKQFWISKIQIDGLEKAYPSYSTTLGKGTSREECLASNYGELYEKLAWEIWADEHKNLDGAMTVYNLNNKKDEYIDLESIKSYFWNGSNIASGNNAYEARYHALMDVIEMGGAGKNNPFPFFPLETHLVDYADMFPWLDQSYIDNIHIMVQRDPRIPSVYIVSAWRAPNDGDAFMISPVSYKNGTIHFNDIPDNWTPMLNNTADPWPPYIGRRFGLNLEKLIPIAIAEMMQVYWFYNQDPATPKMPWKFEKRDVKKYQDFWPIKHISEFQNNETNTIEGDVNLVLNEMFEAGFSVWEADMSLPESPMANIKLFSDYTYGFWTPGMKEIMKYLFKI